MRGSDFSALVRSWGSVMSISGGTQTAPDQQWQAQYKAQKEPRVHPGEQGVVAQVFEVRDAAFFGAEVAHGRVDVDRPYAGPPQPHHRLGGARSEEHTSELQSQSNLV